MICMCTIRGNNGVDSSFVNRSHVADMSGQALGVILRDTEGVHPEVALSQPRDKGNGMPYDLGQVQAGVRVQCALLLQGAECLGRRH